MHDITRILDAAAAGDRVAADELLPLVYEELRKLAAARLSAEAPNQTLQPTALVHEAYLRLVGTNADGEEAKLAKWENRGHFFAAAAEAMRRILVDSARAKQSQKRGGEHQRVELSGEEVSAPAMPPLEVLAIHEALDALAAKSPRKAELVKLRYFLGCTIPEAAKLLGIAPATAEDDWTYARAWLRRRLAEPT